MRKAYVLRQQADWNIINEKRYRKNVFFFSSLLSGEAWNGIMNIRQPTMDDLIFDRRGMATPADASQVCVRCAFGRNFESFPLG